MKTFSPIRANIDLECVKSALDNRKRRWPDSELVPNRRLASHFFSGGVFFFFLGKKGFFGGGGRKIFLMVASKNNYFPGLAKVAALDRKFNKLRMSNGDAGMDLLDRRISRSEFKTESKCRKKTGLASTCRFWCEMVKQTHFIFHYMGEKVSSIGTQEMIWSSKIPPPSSGSIAPTLTMQKSQQTAWSFLSWILAKSWQEAADFEFRSDTYIHRPTAPFCSSPFSHSLPS